MFVAVGSAAGPGGPGGPGAATGLEECNRGWSVSCRQDVMVGIWREEWRLWDIRYHIPSIGLGYGPWDIIFPL